MDNSDLHSYFDLIRQFERAGTDLEKREIGKQMAKLLCSESVSIRRSAKYKLRDWFGAGQKELAQWSNWGPPEQAEILWWENFFEN